jgi:predicted AlkP superfamily phosphohydrolase/phosphomutase
VTKINGICRFLLLNTEPEFELYVTAINIDPVKPVMPIAHPSVYSTYLAKRHGCFATLGLAEDTWALNEKALTDQGFLDQAILIEQERESMFFDALDKLHRGLCVCVFDGTDRIQHAFWRHLDEGHPAHPAETDKSQEASPIEMVYRRMDAIVGRTMARCADSETILMVISDHGFTTFRYGVDLNAWLEQNGYLTVKEGERGHKYLGGVDWSRSRAYALGLAGIYLNLKGREAQGIVDPGEEAHNIREAIASELMQLRDNATDQMPVKNVYPAPEVYTGPYVGNAPDLIVGFNREYRAAWEMAVGEVTDKVFHLNTKAWSGDHCVDRSLVPGVLFCNRPIETDQPRLIDIGPTIMSMFGIAESKHMDGKAFVLSDS